MVINEIEVALREALAHLYDPSYQPSPVLCKLLSCENHDRNVVIQTKIVQGIESLKPAADVPASSRTVRYYEILHNRFVLRLTLEETALRMHMSLSSTWREQRSAIHSLAVELWRQNQAGSMEAVKEEINPQVDEPSSDWHAQAKRELAALQSQAPDAVSEVGKLIQQVIELESPLAAKRGIRLEMGPIKPNLLAAIHPSLLRQIIIIAIGQFLRNMTTGKISLFGRLEDGSVKVTVTGSIQQDPEKFEQTLLSELPLPDDSSAEVYRDGKQIFLWVKLPYVTDRLNVLVIDDNQDMVHYYQRSTEGTSYRIIPFEGEQDVFAAIQKTRPDIILLDVMLPYMDGWELLMQIRANALTRSIPVIVCSVVKEEELALSLGAARFISKPVSSQELVRALDQVLAQTP